MSTTWRNGFDEKGRKVRILERASEIRTRNEDGTPATIRGLSSLVAEDGEQLTPDADGWFRAIHTGRRFKIAD